jgi:hypothetical protein
MGHPRTKFIHFEAIRGMVHFKILEEPDAQKDVKRD